MLAGSRPDRAYEMTIRVCTSILKGTVRSTASLTRLRVCRAQDVAGAATPARWPTGRRAGDQRGGVGGQVGGDQGQVISAGGGSSRATIRRTARVCHDPDHRQVTAVTCLMCSRP